MGWGNVELLVGFVPTLQVLKKEFPKGIHTNKMY